MKRFSNIAPAMLAALIALSGIAHADEDDQERARRALEAGEAMPLSLVLEAVTSRIGGEVVGVEIDHEAEVDCRCLHNLDASWPNCPLYRKALRGREKRAAR